MAGLDDDAAARRCSADSARRIAAARSRCRSRRRAGPQSISQPLTFARIHQYLSMATPLLWTRQADTIGVLGLALNACDERSNGHREATEQIRELLETRARAVADAAGGRGRAAIACRTRATAFRLLHLANIVAVTSACLSRQRRTRTSVERAGRTDARRGAARGSRPDGDEDRLRRGPLRRLHGPARRRARALVHHARAHGRRPRGDDDRGPARPPARARVRARRTRSSAASARPGRSSRRRRSSRRTPSPTRERDSARHGREPLPLRRVFRTSRRRLRRGEADPHGEGGRGPVRGGLDGRRGGRTRPVAGGAARRRRPAGAAPGRARARPRRGPLHGRRRASRGCSTPRCCAARTRPRACARSTSRPALALPGVHDAISLPGTSTSSPTSRAIPGEAVAAVAADTRRAGARRGRGDRGRVGGRASRCSTRRGRPRGSQLTTETSHYARGDLEAGFAEADVVVEAEYRTQTVLHNSMETHQAVCEWEGDTLDVYISTQYIWGVRDAVAEALRPAARPRPRRLRVHGRRLRLEERARRLHADRGRARAPHRASRPLRADPARGERRPPATATRRSSGCGPARAPTARSSRSAASS